jgi:hypothetical protein
MTTPILGSAEAWNRQRHFQRISEISLALSIMNTVDEAAIDRLVELTKCTPGPSKCTDSDAVLWANKLARRSNDETTVTPEGFAAARWLERRDAKFRVTPIRDDASVDAERQIVKGLEPLFYVLARVEPEQHLHIHYSRDAWTPMGRT